MRQGGICIVLRGKACVRRLRFILSIHSPPVRMPEPIEPGVCYDLQLGFNGAVTALQATIEPQTGSLLDRPRVIITEWLTVQLLRSN